MEAILKVPYNYSDPYHDFDASEEIVLDGSVESQQRWAKSKMEYEKECVNVYNKYKPIIERNIRRLGQNISINNEGEKEKNSYKQQGYYFTETKAIVCDMNNRRITIDELIEYYKSGEMFILVLQLPVYDKDEDLEYEIKAWKRETMKINRAQNLTDEEKVTGYTKRDLKLEFANSSSSALLKNTKMVDIVNNHAFAFLVEQIVFLNNK